MPRKYLISVIALFVFGLVLSFLMFRLAMGDVLQADRVAQMPGVVEPLGVLAEVIFVLGFVWVWSQGVDPAKGTLGQGLRYGLAVGLMTFVPAALLIGAMVPDIGPSVLGWVATTGPIKVILMGAVLSQIHRPEAPPATAL